MPGKTKIEWSENVWNCVTGCAKVSAGCKNCYAERLWPKIEGARYARELKNQWKVHAPRPFTEVRCHPDHLEKPLYWRKPRRIFVNSMSDLFHPDVPDDFIDKVFAIMALCPQHKFQILTKRPERMREYLTGMNQYFSGGPRRDRDWFVNEAAIGITRGNAPLFDWPIKNCWLGVSVEDQDTANERIPLLLDTPAALRFVSAEPLLGPIEIVHWMGGNSHRCKCGWHDTQHDLTSFGAVDPLWLCGKCSEYVDTFPALDWVISGGESGPGARPAHPDWLRQVRDQCKAAGVPFFMKQMGGVTKKAMPPIPDDLRIQEYPNANT